MGLVVVSNRLPVRLQVHGDGRREITPGPGGLVTALAPVLRDRGGTWIGWSGTADVPHEELEPLFAGAARAAGYRLRPVLLGEEDVRDFYHGFANEVLWPLFHDLQTRCRFLPRYWYRYLDVNRRFAREIVRWSRREYIWVHDYHLVHVGQALRSLGVDRRIGFFLHVPFPPVDVFLRLPWRAEILRALLAYDLIGFQTPRDRRNFLQCLQHLVRDLRPQGRGPVIELVGGGRTIRVGAFPISIDFREFNRLARTPEVTRRVRDLRQALGERKIVLGVDRLDYTKGIPERLEAFRTLLERHPDLRGKISLVQVVVPSREGVEEYQQLKAEIERLVGDINGRFTGWGWVPIHYHYRSLPRDELVAWYRAADIAFVTPLKDGMNLVAKEYCACQVDGGGLLVLSEFAGAAAQLHRGALLVNPHDIEGVAETLYRGITMDPAERRARMRRLRDNIRRYDIFWWVDAFLEAAYDRRLHDFPHLEDFLPDVLLPPGPPMVHPARGTT